MSAGSDRGGRKSPHPSFKSRRSSGSRSNPRSPPPLPSEAVPELPDRYRVDNQDIIDMDIFGPILTLDSGDPAREFSKGLVSSWTIQAQEILVQIKSCLAAEELDNVGNRADFLQGSSAALGVRKVAATCASLHKLSMPGSSILSTGRRSASQGTSPAPSPTPIDQILRLETSSLSGSSPSQASPIDISFPIAASSLVPPIASPIRRSSDQGSSRSFGSYSGSMSESLARSFSKSEQMRSLLQTLEAEMEEASTWFKRYYEKESS